MKLATFTTESNEDPRYGFKNKEYIIDILYLSKFLQEKNNDDRFLNLPHSLKESLKDWNKNFKKFDDLHTFDNFPEANAKDARILHPHIFTAELESCLNE